MSRLTSKLLLHRLSASFAPMFMLVLMSILSFASLAESPRWYEVEVALIGYQDDQKINHENWPEILIKDQPTDTVNEIADVLTREEIEPWSWIDWWNNEGGFPHNLYQVNGELVSNMTVPKLTIPFVEQGIAFANEIERFSKTTELQLIWSRKWQQPIPEKEDAELAKNAVKINFRIPLNFQEILKSSTPLLEAEVTGELYLYRSRYLHLVSKLNIQHWQSLNSNRSIDKFINVLPSHPIDSSNIIPSNISTPLTAINEIPLRAASINQSRRMRSNELHYIDHPLLGILVRVTPLAEVTE
ncbi:MAG: hypothetical protein ACI9DG_002444 [Oleispira sp.]|jgi:hypothetical protein